MADPKAPILMVLNRNQALHSLLGHRIVFKKDTPVHVPASIYREAVAIGATRVDGDAPNVGDDPKEPNEPATVEERAEKIREAIELLVSENNRDDFTAAGAPSAEAVTRLAGFKVQTKEIKPVWAAFQADQAGE